MGFWTGCLLFDRGFIEVPQLPSAVVTVPDTAQGTPGRSLTDFPGPLISGQEPLVQAVLGLQGDPGPCRSGQAGPPGATP